MHIYVVIFLKWLSYYATELCYSLGGSLFSLHIIDNSRCHSIPCNMVLHSHLNQQHIGEKQEFRYII